MRNFFLKHTTFMMCVSAIFLFIGIVIGALLVLVTPLRFFDLVEPQINEISPPTFYHEFTAAPDNYIFIDVRTNADYVAGHAPGAINVPLETLYTQRHFLPKHGKTIAIICNNAQASGVAFSYLQHFGFYNIVRVTGGMTAWKADGLPVVIGDFPYASTTSKVTLSYKDTTPVCA
jgi:rhodanese-related sulfurtransferase